jgi:hypothetical protein
MVNEFIVLQDADGEYRPLAFITRNNEAGEYSAKLYAKDMEEGETLVIVKFVEIGIYEN